jgi:streptomycin 6-kinase
MDSPMNRSTHTPDLALVNGTVIPGETVAQFLWADRERGLRWVEALNAVLAEWCERWQITLAAEVPTHSMNLVLFGRSDVYGPVVIKTSPPHEEITAEIDALRAHASPRIVGLIDADPTVSIMLQRRILPGETLRSHVETGRLTERHAAEIAARLMREYWVEPSPGSTVFPLDRWFRSLYAYRDRYPDEGGRLERRNLELAIRHADELLASQRDALTLHGDLHHDNILLDEEYGWTIIDPKGLVGERGYDIGQWMVNPIGVHLHPDLAQLTDSRLDWFTEYLGIERYRLWQWAMIQTVLSDCWNLESDDEAELYAQPIASILANLPEARRS